MDLKIEKTKKKIFFLKTKKKILLKKCFSGNPIISNIQNIILIFSEFLKFEKIGKTKIFFFQKTKKNFFSEISFFFEV